ncbi:hypothetical protein K3495_g2036 [Podosphaera aphanis]|nr:hypothetical protein K3495_g2036 [Podosphaera aphanis]
MNVNQMLPVSTVEAMKSNKTTIQKIGIKRPFEEHQDKTNRSIIDVTNGREFRRPDISKNTVTTLTPGKIIDVNYRKELDSHLKTIRPLTPSPQQNPKLDLAHEIYGLPLQLVKNMASLGINSIYPWQSDCLVNSGALGGKRNLVYSAPTGGGKSLVADVLMLKKITENPGKKALLVLP